MNPRWFNSKKLSVEVPSPPNTEEPEDGCEGEVAILVRLPVMFRADDEQLGVC